MANEFGIGDYVFDPTCGEEGFIVGLSPDGATALVQYLTGNGPEEDKATCADLEHIDRPDSSPYDVEEACQMCKYLHHANVCAVQPGEYCKRYHRFEPEV